MIASLTLILGDTANALSFTGNAGDYLPPAVGVFGAFIPLLLVAALNSQLRKYAVIWLAIYGVATWLGYLFIIQLGVYWSYSNWVTFLMLVGAVISLAGLLFYLDLMERSQATHPSNSDPEVPIPENNQHQAENKAKPQAPAAFPLINVDRTKWLALAWYSAAILLLAMAASNHWRQGQVVVLVVESRAKITAIDYRSESNQTAVHVRWFQGWWPWNQRYHVPLPADEYAKMKELILTRSKQGSDPDPDETIARGLFWPVVAKQPFGKVYEYRCKDVSL